MAEAAPSSGGNLVTFVQDQIKSGEKSAPPWLRAFVYFIFVMLFAYAFMHAVGGDFAVHGQLFEGNSVVANSYDVCIGDGRYGANSIGDYYAVLNPSTYYSLLAVGAVRVSVYKGTQCVDEEDVTFARWSGKLGRVHVGSKPCTGEAAPQRARALSLSLIPSAFAQPLPAARTNRLFIERLQVSDREATDGEATLSIDSNQYPLMFDGRPAGKLPLLSGRELLLGDRFYFAIPPVVANKRAKLTISSKTGIFSQSTETYTLTVPLLGRSGLGRSTNGNAAHVAIRHLGPR